LSAQGELAAVGLGSNLGDRAGHLEAGLAALAATPGVRVLARSAWVETEPVGGPPGAPRFLNGAALLETTLAPRALLERLLAIEAARGRVRRAGERDRPRTLDLDLLVHGGRVVAEPGLELPHPRLERRAFVLRPLAEIAPGLVLPGSGRTVAQALAELEGRAARATPGAAAGSGAGAPP
jgi:2-amino-4-hydroxy-6-hydroxymethyldihydropteridine diphosphokinase